MRSPRDFTKPLAMGAPQPVLEIPVKPSRCIHFFDPSNPKMAAKLAQLEARHQLKRPLLVHAILETALGVTNVEEICAASPRMQGISFGPADLAASRRMKTTRVGGGHPAYLVRTDPDPKHPDAPRPTAQQDPWHYSIARMHVAAVQGAGAHPRPRGGQGRAPPPPLRLRPMSAGAFFAQHEVHVGQDVGGRALTLSEADVARYQAGTGGASTRPAGAAPALILHSEVYRSLAWYLPNIFGNLHARQEWELFAPVLVGQPIRTRATVVDRYRKRNREYVVNEVLVTDAEGRWLQRSRTHQSFLVEDGGRDTVVDRGREKRPERVFTVGEAPGEPIGPFTRPITLAMCEAFSGPEKNYHNDREMARMLGFPDIVVQGMLSVCLVSELMTETFGAGWLLGGKMDVRLVNVVWVDDVLATRGKVREEVAEGSHRRVHLDVWCEKADGTKALVGTASALR